MSVKLTMSFKNADDSKFSYNFNNAKNNLTDATVKAAMEAIIENGSIYKKVPTRMVEAYKTVTDKTVFDLS